MITVQEAEERGLERVTLWYTALQAVPSQWGTIGGHSWVCQEAIRLGSEVEAVLDEKGRAAIYMTPPRERL